MTSIVDVALLDLSHTWDPRGNQVTTMLCDKIKSLPGVLSVKKCPCRKNEDGSLTELGLWKVWHFSFAYKTILDIVNYHKLDGKRHISYTSDSSTERFKTGGHYYAQMIMSDSPKNREILEQVCQIWGLCGWENVVQNIACGWISARGSRNRRGNNEDHKNT